MRGAILIWILGCFGFVKFTDASIVSEIPPNLIDCYNDSLITIPDDLLPMNMPTFIALLRKAENDQSVGSTTNMRTLSATILHRMRFDGLLQNPSISTSQNPGIIPFSPSGSEFYTYRILFDSLLPDPGFYFDNSTFTRKEKCTLHRMLSLSINPYVLDVNNPSCPNTIKDNEFNRRPREISKLDDVEEFHPEEEMEERQNYMHHDPYLQDPNQIPFSQCPLESGVVYTSSGSVSLGLVMGGIATGLQQIRVNQVNLMQIQPKLKPHLGPSPRGPSPSVPLNRGLNRPSPVHPRVYAGYQTNQGGYPGNQGGYPGNQGGYPGSQGGYPGSQGGYPGSQGGYPGNQGGYPGNQGGYPGNGGRPTPPNRGYGFGSGGPNTIDNTWAHTVAGILANSALITGPTNSMTIGMKGGWNSTAMPKYYFLDDNQADSVTEPRLRGGLDGLIMSKNVDQWTRLTGNNLKLSQLFSMYYSNRGVMDPTMKGCNRRQTSSSAMPEQETAYQTNQFAQVLTQHQPNVPLLSDDVIQQFSFNAADEAIHFIVNSMTDKGCDNGGTPNQGPTVIPAADLLVVIDCTWEYKKIQAVLQSLMEHAQVQPYRSNITIISAKNNNNINNATFVYSVTNLLDAQIGMYNYTMCPQGFDMAFAMVKLKEILQNKMEYDKQMGTSLPWNNDVARVVVFLPSPGATVDGSTATYVLDKLQRFKVQLPDVKFLYLIAGSKDNFNQFADDSKNDVFTLMIDDVTNSVVPLAKRISQVQRRIVNPLCGRYWSYNNYGTMTLTEHLSSNEIHFFRVHPNYFYKGASGNIVVQPSSGGSITVCLSRSNPWPSKNGTQSSDSTCQSVTVGTTYNILNFDSNTCGSSYTASNCQPIYFSVQAIQQLNQGSICSDQTCEFPDMMTYKLSHSGLSCYSSALRLLTSPLAILPIIAITIFNMF